MIEYLILAFVIGGVVGLFIDDVIKMLKEMD